VYKISYGAGDESRGEIYPTQDRYTEAGGEGWGIGIEYEYWRLATLFVFDKLYYGDCHPAHCIVRPLSDRWTLFFVTPRSGGTGRRQLQDTGGL